MHTLNLFMPLTKVDVDSRTVHGVATAEAPDRAGEICDYDSTKPYFEAWSAEAQAASGGKSLGAVRAMHQRIAAGKLTDIAFDDQANRSSSPPKSSTTTSGARSSRASIPDSAKADATSRAGPTRIPASYAIPPIQQRFRSSMCPACLARLFRS